MFKSKVHIKAFSILLSLWMCFISTGFTVERHFCGEILKDISFWGSAEVCEHEKKVVSSHDCCHKTEKTIETETEIKSNCCSSDKSFFKFNSEYEGNKKLLVALFVQFKEFKYLSFGISSMEIKQIDYSDNLHIPPPNYIHSQSFIQRYTI